MKKIFLIMIAMMLAMNFSVLSLNVSHAEESGGYGHNEMGDKDSKMGHDEKGEYTPGYGHEEMGEKDSENGDDEKAEDTGEYGHHENEENK